MTQYKLWTTAELQRGHDFYRSHTIEETAAFLGRSKTSVANTFHRLGIKKTREEKQRSKRYSRDRFRIQRDELAKSLREAGLHLKYSDTAAAKRIIKAAIVKLDQWA